MAKPIDSAHLSTVVREGLQSLNTVISLELTKKVISNAVKMALHSSMSVPNAALNLGYELSFTLRPSPRLDVPGNPEIYATHADYTKQAEYAILTLLFVALKHGWDAVRLRAVLEEASMAVSPAATDELVDAYASHRADLYVHSLTTGQTLPHLTDVEWKLTCDVRTSQLADGSAGGALNYTISLGRFQASGDRESIATFQCNVEELQALVGKLKDIERHCDRLAREK